MSRKRPASGPSETPPSGPAQGEVFLIDWDDARAAAQGAELRAAGWRVEVESRDGAAAYRRIRSMPPDVVVVVAASHPSHGAETARSLRETRATREIPILFVDADEAAREQIARKVDDARFVTSGELAAALDRASGRPGKPASKP